jgi:hypothetical protein
MPGLDDLDIAGAVSEIGSSLFDTPSEGSTGDSDGNSDDGALGDLGLDRSAPAAKPANSPAPAAPAAPASPAGAPVADGAGKTGGDPNAVGEKNPDGTPKAAPGPNDPPKTWSKEGQAAWATLSPVAQAEVRKREEDFHRGIEVYKADAADGKAFQQLLTPYEHILKHYNINPFPLMSGLMEAHHNLATGTPEQKVAMFRKLAQDYGVNLETAAAPAPYEDPAVIALREQNQRLQSQLGQTAEQARAAFQATLEQQLDAFEADPKHVHFKDVGHDMVPFINAGLSLEAAYEKAIWANPKTRALENARLTAEANAKAAKDEADRVAAAKRAAGANVRTSAKSGSATAPLGSMDDTMAETLAAIRNRA